MKIAHHHATDCFDWLISRQQSINPWREAIFIVYGKYKRFTFVHPVVTYEIWLVSSVKKFRSELKAVFNQILQLVFHLRLDHLYVLLV